MLISVDIDEVLADYMPELLRFYNRRAGTNHRREDVREYLFAAITGLDRDMAHRQVMDFLATGGLAKLSPLPGATHYAPLIGASHPLIAITARPEEYRSTTEKWLDTHFPGVFGEVHFSGFHDMDPMFTKGELCEMLGVGLHIDDHLHHLQSVADKGIATVALTTPWNASKQLPLLCTRADDWHAIYVHIMDGSWAQMQKQKSGY